ncbi:hypothetical protein A607_0398 [Helicobacter pylori UMB_G1]|nr:hypothetical protein A607_0398 [Helicobacter pylori UMB_G1]
MCELFYICFKMPLSIFITNIGINPNPKFVDFYCILNIHQ